MRAGLVLLLGAAALAGCSKPKKIIVDDAWVRLAAVPRGTAAAYFTIHGGPKDATLIAVNTDVAIGSEMHQSMGTDGMATMKPLGSVPVPARAEVAFAPGGRHVMLFDMNPGIKPGRPITLILSFGDGSRVFQSAKTVAAGGAKPE